MEGRNEFYKITKKGDIFEAASEKAIYFSSGDICDLKQCGFALITTEVDNTHSVYLPTYIGEFINYDIPAVKVISDVIGYQYFNGMLLLKKSGYCVVIEVDSYIWYISYPNVAEGREKNLKRINFSEEAYIREELGELVKAIVFRADGKDYLAEHVNFNVYKTDRQIEITPLEEAKILYKYSEDRLIKIEAFDEEMYSKISKVLDDSGKCYRGYWFKDFDGNILKMAIYYKEEKPIYELVFKKGVKAVTFMSRDRISKEHNLDIWKITCTNGQERILVKRGEKVYY